MSSKVVTRFAPSPTGFMHVGGIRTALFAYLWARKHDGIFILRIEDTDKEREVEGSKEHIIESLRWLGITWDYGPDKPGDFGSCIQSERLSIYKKYAQKLLEKGFAYVDPFTEEEVETFRKKAEEEKRPFLFREHRPETLDTTWDGTKPLRFKTPVIKNYEWKDEVRGKLSAGQEALDDFILIKKDGYPTYNFAHIVDDIEMGVTHVMRGEEFIASTPKFLSVYEALDTDAPIYVTLPPILGDTGTKKLSKRDGAKDILEYRAEGYVPEAIVNFLAFLGWNPGDDREVMTVLELTDAFELSKIQKSGARFNPEKLDWVNKEHMKRKPLEESYKLMLSYFESESLTPLIKERLTKLAPVAFDRASKYGDFFNDYKADEYGYISSKPALEASKLTWKGDTLEQAKTHLTHAKNALEKLPESNWSPEEIKSVLWPYAEENGRGNVLWPIRYALSGKDKSPDPFTLLYVLGKEESLKRLSI